MQLFCPPLAVLVMFFLPVSSFEVDDGHKKVVVILINLLLARLGR